MALLFGIAAFAGALLIYAAIFRLHLVLGSARVLASILFGGALLGAVALSFITAISIADVLLALTISWSLALAFLVANTAIEIDSPTQSLVIFLHAHRPNGVTEEMLDAFIIDRPFRDSRLRGLIADGLVERRGGWLVCRSGTRVLLYILDGYRSIILRNETTG